MPCFVLGKLISKCLWIFNSIPFSDCFLISSHVAGIVLGYLEKQDK